MKVLVIGGGIGGFATALSLHAAGVECEVFEQSHSIRELGVGVNILPHAVKELAKLGLLAELDRVAIRTQELIYTNRFGQILWREPRGLDAGYDYPQFSIHRGKLQGALYEASQARIGEDNIHTAHQLRDFAQDDHGVTATFIRRDGRDETVISRGDALIAADGIHSTARRLLYPNEGTPAWNGMMMWRGAIEYQPFLTGRSMIIAGGKNKARLVLYPMSDRTSKQGTNLLNWAVAVKLSDGSDPPPQREDWSRVGRLDDVLPHVEQAFEFSTIDLGDVIRNTEEFYEYPMCDRDPLPQWSFGLVTLLGDAAHPMYPYGSNGASQAILDASCVASHLAEKEDVVKSLRAYEAERLSATAKIVQDNRIGGPERVIDVVEERAPNGFANLAEVVNRAELEAIIKSYSRTAGFDQTQVNP
jgi:2-polyprenyl-6-methoxyphenol hydroxylase-like FAD-dependent oxidoreductase